LSNLRAVQLLILSSTSIADDAILIELFICIPLG
jgi:hypothetical protein